MVKSVIINSIIVTYDHSSETVLTVGCAAIEMSCDVLKIYLICL